MEHVVRLRLEVPYITKEKKVDTRYVQVVMPEGASQPMPLIYVPHYEMGEDSQELRDYLEKGWAVACPAEFKNEYNKTITDDDLVFNNAALYTLRHREEFDKNRICLVGGSAGAYMTMMLNGLQLGHCASIANGAINNVYFNVDHYFVKANELNMKAFASLAAQKAQEETKAESVEKEDEKAEENPALALLKSLQALPLPFLAALNGSFSPVANNFPKKEDPSKWEALSPVGIADSFCSPIMMNHSTSDVLVPVDQITKKYTYEKPGDSLPEDFDARLPKSFPGKLKYSLEECLPEYAVRTECFVVPETDEDTVLPYDSSKQFNINIFDDGPIEGYGTHSSRMGGGRRLDVPYLEEMFKKGAAETCQLTTAMLKRLLLRYQGESIALPACVDVDDNAYGSLAIYQKEICEELAQWIENHKKEAFIQIYNKMMTNETDEVVREKLSNCMQEVMNKIEMN